MQGKYAHRVEEFRDLGEEDEMVYQAQREGSSCWIHQTLLHVGTMSLQSRQRRCKFLLVSHVAPSRSATRAYANVCILFESKTREQDDQGFLQWFV
jgi:hypothetical protein